MRSLAVAAAMVALSGCGKAPDPALQGYVEGEFVRIAAPFAGTLVKLEVRRGQEVEAGAALFALEAESEQAARREAEERLRRTQAQVENLRKGPRPTEIESVRAQLSQAETAAALSAKELARQEDLVAKGFVSRQALDEARANRDRDRGRVAQLQAELATARAGTRPDEVRAAQAEAEAARASLAQADWRLRQKTVAATVTGMVTDTLFAQGEWIAAGAPVVALLPPENVKVRFFVPEPKLGSVRIGQAIEASCDGCKAPVQARVTYVAPQAEYTPPVIYSKDNRARLVFLVEAKPSPEAARTLHPGQPVDVVLK